MWRRRSAMILALCGISLGCATAPGIAPVHLPEPTLPACVVETPPAADQIVGRYEFDTRWALDQIMTPWVSGDNDKRLGALEAMQGCASQLGQRLRQAVGTIRANNREAR